MCAARKKAVAKSARNVDESAPVSVSGAESSSDVSTSKIERQSFCGGFQKHLERIRCAKARTDALMDSDSALDVSEASLALIWEMVFDRLCSMPDADISDIGTVAGIVQKLFATDSKRKSSRADKPESEGISEATLKQIEEKLKLL